MLPTKIIARDKSLSLNPPIELDLELPKISKSKLKLLENADFISPGEKLELLMILTRHQFAGEIKLHHRHSGPVQNLINNLPEIQRIKELLIKLNLPYFVNSRVHSKKGLIRWIQVSANPAIHQFVKRYSKTMSGFEAGLLYGYPPTAILAFMNLISKQSGGIYHPADYWFSLVRSKDWNTEERKHYRQIFQTIKKISPSIYQELIHSFQKRSNLIH